MGSKYDPQSPSWPGESSMVTKHKLPWPLTWRSTQAQVAGVGHIEPKWPQLGPRRLSAVEPTRASAQASVCTPWAFTILRHPLRRQWARATANGRTGASNGGDHSPLACPLKEPHQGGEKRRNQPRPKAVKSALWISRWILRWIFFVGLVRGKPT